MSGKLENKDGQEQPENFDRQTGRSKCPSTEPDAFTFLSLLIPFLTILTSYAYLLWTIAHGVLISKGGNVDLSKEPKFLWLALPLLLIMTGVLIFVGCVLIRAIHRKLFSGKR